MTQNATAMPALAPIAPAPTMPAAPPRDHIAVVVSQRHLEHGLIFNAHDCPVALALRGMGFTAIDVGYYRVKASGVEWDVPAELDAWLRDFDDAKPVSPERFVLHRSSPVG